MNQIMPGGWIVAEAIHLIICRLERTDIWFLLVKTKDTTKVIVARQVSQMWLGKDSKEEFHLHTLLSPEA